MMEKKKESWKLFKSDEEENLYFIGAKEGGKFHKVLFKILPINDQDFDKYLSHLNLAAAAPELLEACERALVCLNGFVYDIGFDGLVNDETLEILRNLDDAINKAKGTK